MEFGLKDKDILLVQQVLSLFNEVESAFIYGSRAKGNYKPSSDIDLTLTGSGIDLTLLNKIANELDDLLLPYTFDLSVMDKISNPDLVEHIKRVGVKFYERKDK
jgi:predicted nucleotidyltransferase